MAAMVLNSVITMFLNKTIATVLLSLLLDSNGAHKHFCISHNECT